MKTKNIIDKRRLWLFLPLFAGLILCIAFYKMDGGQGSPGGLDSLGNGGINTGLPEPEFKAPAPLSKIGYYELAGRDSSAALRDGNVLAKLDAAGIGKQATGEDARSQAISHRLEQLQRQIAQPDVPERRVTGSTGRSAAGMQQDVDRLEGLMRTMQQDRSGDQEMQQINRLMENILEVQQPGRAGLHSGTVEVRDSLFTAIRAEVDGTQKVSTGGAVRLRLLDSVRLNGLMVPKGHVIFGMCRLISQRLLLDIKNIRLGNRIVPVDLSLWSLDGMAGLAAPEALGNEALRGGAPDVLSGVSALGLDPSFGAQMAGAGIDAARGMLQRRVRPVRVKVKAGELVLLRNNALKAR